MPLFDWSAGFYDLGVRLLGVAYPELVAAVEAGPGDLVADVAGGTGAVARRLVERSGARVVVVDPSLEMMRRVPSHPRIARVRGVAGRLPFPDGALAALVTASAFHHFPSHREALEEARRCLRPGGLLAVQDFDFARRLVHRLGPPFEAALGESVRFVDGRDVAELAAACGFEGASRQVNLLQYLYVGRRR